MRIVTLSSDFGISDYACGIMAGVVLKIAPDVRVLDISHDIPRHDIMAGSRLLDRCLPYFPEGTIHVMVVDPGVGTHRKPMAARLGSQFFVGPDNGLITLGYERARSQNWPIEFFHLDHPEFFLPVVSRVFHGRDVFAPAAGHIASGIPLEQIGTRIDEPVLLPIPLPSAEDFGWVGEVMHIDRFGNLSTNITANHLAGMGPVQIAIGGEVISGLSKTFGSAPPGELIALMDSSGYLCISVVNGSAAGRLKAKSGARVEVYPLSND